MPSHSSTSSVVNTITNTTTNVGSVGMTGADAVNYATVVANTALALTQGANQSQAASQQAFAANLAAEQAAAAKQQSQIAEQAAEVNQQALNTESALFKNLLTATSQQLTAKQNQLQSAIVTTPTGSVTDITPASVTTATDAGGITTKAIAQTSPLPGSSSDMLSPSLIAIGLGGLILIGALFL